MADGIGGIGSSGLSSFDFGGIAPNGGGSGPTGTGALGDAGLSPIGSTGLTAFGLDGPVGGRSEAAKLDHYDSLVQQNWDKLDANAQSNADLSRSVAQMGQPGTPPSFTMQPIAPPRFDPPPPTFPTFTLPPPATVPAPLPTFASQPLDTAGFTPPAPTAPTFTLPEAAGGPIPAAPKPADLPAPIPAPSFPPFAMAPDALASPVISPAINAPVVSDPFAPVDQGGVGFRPIGRVGPTAFVPALGTDTAFAATVPPPAKPIGSDSVTILGADPAIVDAPAQEPGFLARAGTRIAENFSRAFESPLGPGPGYDEITRPTGYGIIDGFNQPLFRVFDGILTVGDAAGRTLAAGYNSLIDTGTEGLASSGLMSNGSANRLGRDIKLMLESSAGAATAVSGLRLRTLGARGIPENGTAASNVALHANYIDLLRTTEAANPLVDSLKSTGSLPANYITKADALRAGWQPGKALENYVSGAQIGGDVYRNANNLVPTAPGRIWYEADVGLNGTMSRAKQPGTRLLYSNDGHMYVTFDHYEAAHPIGRYSQ